MKIKQHYMTHHMKPKANCGAYVTYNYDGLCDWKHVTCKKCLKTRAIEKVSIEKLYGIGDDK